MARVDLSIIIKEGEHVVMERLALRMVARRTERLREHFLEKFQFWPFLVVKGRVEGQ